MEQETTDNDSYTVLVRRPSDTFIHLATYPTRLTALQSFEDWCKITTGVLYSCREDDNGNLVCVDRCAVDSTYEPPTNYTYALMDCVVPHSERDNVKPLSSVPELSERVRLKLEAWFRKLAQDSYDASEQFGLGPLEYVQEKMCGVRRSVRFIDSMWDTYKTTEAASEE